MWKITTLFVIFTCLTTAFALNASLTKSYFFVNNWNHLSYKLFHTTNGIIAYNLEYSESGAIPQYLLLNPAKGYATVILEDILSSCGHTEDRVFDRLQYHVKTSTLAYFCLANNSLLVLDEETYAVQDILSTGISANFSEAKLTADGTSLYVLLTGALYSENQIPSQLVQIDLATRTIIRSVVFDQGLQTNEYVNGFVSQNNEAYALTNTIDLTSGVNVISIYSVTLTGNTYQLLQLADFINGGNARYLSQLYQLGDYLVTNNLDNVVCMDKQGNIVNNFVAIGSKASTVKTVSTIPAIVSEEGSSDLYLIMNYNYLYKVTAQSGSIISQPVGTVYDFQIAYGNYYTTDLLFTIDMSQSNFSITTLQNSELIYSMPSFYDDFMITNSTFAVLRSYVLFVYNRQSNALIGNVSLPTPFYLHKDTDTLYFSKLSDDYTSCVIKQLDLITLSIVDIKEYPDFELCSELIFQFKISDAVNLEFVAADTLNNIFTIFTETYGIVTFDPAKFASDTEYIVPDYETLSLYRLQSNYSANSTTVSYYEYNNTQFTLKNSYDIGGHPVSTFYSSGNQKAFAFSEGSFRIIDLEYGSTTEYSFPTLTKTVSSFQDNEGKNHLIFSDSRGGNGAFWVGNVTEPSLFDSYGVSQLPGTNKFTVQAGAAGPCAYWIVDGFISSVGLVKFYDACVQEDTSMFSILQ